MVKDQLVKIDSVESVDESNYLDIDYRLLGKESGNVEFENNIQQLWNTRSAIKTATELGLQDRISPPVQQYYLESVRWLKGQAATANWIAINPLGQSGDRNTEMNQFSGSWMPNYLSSFFSSPLLVSFYAEGQKARNVLLSKGITQEIETSTQKALDNIEATGKTSVDNVNESINAQREGINKELETTKEYIASTKNDIEQTIALSKLTSWADYFEKRVKEYEELVNGTRPLKKKRIKKDFWRVRCSPMWHWSKSLKARRFFWFSSLAFVLVLFVLISTGIWSISLSRELQKEVNNPILFKIGIIAPLLLIPSLGYAFANKNYRIYANILEQYRHREVVAKTLVGIIATFGNDPSTAETRQSLTAIGSQAIFEHKNIGHLTKKDTESMPMSEIFQFFGKR